METLSQSNRIELDGIELDTWHPRKESNLHRPGSKPGAFPLDHAGVWRPRRDLNSRLLVENQATWATSETGTRVSWRITDSPRWRARRDLNPRPLVCSQRTAPANELRGCGQRESSPPFLLGTQVCVHQHFDRNGFWHAVVESNHVLRIWSPFGHHALRRMRRLVRESNPSTGDRQSPCLPSSITRQTGSKPRQSALPRGDGGR